MAANWNVVQLMGIPGVCTEKLVIEPVEESFVAIYNLYGSLIDTFKITSRTEYSTSRFEKGVYMIKIWNYKSKSAFKIVKM